jgi:hypothetical protein
VGGAVIAVVCSVGILDITLVTVAQLRNRLGSLNGGRDLIGLRRVKVGPRIPIAVTVLYGAAIPVGLVEFAISESGKSATCTLAVLVEVLSAGLGILIYKVFVHN